MKSSQRMLMQATLIKFSESHKNNDIKVGVRFVGEGEGA